MSGAHADLWPSGFGQPQQELPDKILTEQAILLGEKTNHLVEADVETPEHSKYVTDRIRLAFYLVAPRLGNYSYRLFTVEYGITSIGGEISGYPVTIVNGTERICEDSNAFTEALRVVFASHETLQIISTLMDKSSP